MLSTFLGSKNVVEWNERFLLSEKWLGLETPLPVIVTTPIFTFLDQEIQKKTCIFSHWYWEGGKPQKYIHHSKELYTPWLKDIWNSSVCLVWDQISQSLKNFSLKELKLKKTSTKLLCVECRWNFILEQKKKTAQPFWLTQPSEIVE